MATLLMNPFLGHVILLTHKRVTRQSPMMADALSAASAAGWLEVLSRMAPAIYCSACPHWVAAYFGVESWPEELVASQEDILVAKPGRVRGT